MYLVQNGCSKGTETAVLKALLTVSKTVRLKTATKLKIRLEGKFDGSFDGSFSGQHAHLLPDLLALVLDSDPGQVVQRVRKAEPGRGVLLLEVSEKCNSNSENFKRDR